jgi:tetratricopeptide (TPR) repeat protein
MPRELFDGLNLKINAMRPLCFVIMPFGKKKDTDGKELDFDEIYKNLIHPAIDNAGMEAIRADEETVNGIIHKPMYERLILCDYSVADLTTANANVFYELGIRHAVKPYTTITIFASGSKLPFDLNAVRCLPYSFDKKKKLTNVENDIKALAQKLKNAKRRKDTDSPVYQLVDGIAFQNSVAHQKTDIFRDQVEYDSTLKKKLQKIRSMKCSKEEKLNALEKMTGKEINVDDEEGGVLVDVMLSYRSISTPEAFQKMIDFIYSMPNHIENTVMVQEQLGFALNRIGEKDEAIKVLETVITQNGPSSETYGILGRVYKDKYDEAIKEKNEALSIGYLDKAIETYMKGFEADWRDAYPGINALTLLEIKGDKDRIKTLAPVVEYAVIRKIQSKTPDYWDYATVLGISVIANDEMKAKDNLNKALASPIEGDWMFKTTLKDMELIYSVRKHRNEEVTVVKKIMDLLKKQIKINA